MKKKHLYLALSLLLLAALALYFRPQSLAAAADPDSRIILVLNEIGIREGSLHLEPTEYRDITPEQKNAILALMEQYSYRRTPGTLFSGGSASDIGNRVLSVYLVEGESSVSSIIVTASGKVTVNDAVFRMTGAEQFITDVLALVEQ